MIDQREKVNTVLNMLLSSTNSIKHAMRKRGVTSFASNQILHAENAEKTMSKFRSSKPIRLRTVVPAKKAAVLIPICIVNEQVSLLYTLRASNLKAHRGQVSFPGGMQDMKDKNFEETALRETEEELGLDRKNVQIWGAGNLIVTGGDTCVMPVIGRIKGDLDLNDLHINPNEVEEVFIVPLQDLCNEKLMGYTQFKGAYSTPLFLGARRKIWGLTALMTHIFLRCLLPAKAYNHKIKFVQAPRSKPIAANI